MRISRNPPFPKVRSSHLISKQEKAQCIKVHLTFQPYLRNGLGLAVMHEVPEPLSLGHLLRQVGDDPHVAIINARLKGLDVGEEFIILSQKRFGEFLNLEGRENILGIHQLTWQGKEYKAVAKLKENEPKLRAGLVKYPG